jgi:hypothetical protein
MELFAGLNEIAAKRAKGISLELLLPQAEY